MDIKYLGLGMNQFKSKKKHNAMKYLYWYIIIVLAIILIGLLAKREALLQAWAQEPIISPVADPLPTYKIPSLNPDISEREQNIQLIKKIWGKDSKIGLGIARCESGYRTKAEHINSNNTIDQGVFQVNSIHNMPDMENAVANIAYSYTKYQEQGISPWLSSKSCWGK